MEPSYFLVFGFIGIWLLFLFLLCLIPANMAESRGRSFWGWLWLSFFIITPIFGIIILACLGDTDRKRRERIIEAEELRLSVLSHRCNQDELNVKPK